MRSGSSVTESEELMGSSSLLSRLPQYLITAMLEAHVAVATCRVGTAQARASRRAQRQQVFTGPVPCARCVDPSRKKTAQRCQQLQRGAFRASRPRLLTLTPLLAFFAGDADILLYLSEEFPFPRRTQEVGHPARWQRGEAKGEAWAIPHSQTAELAGLRTA